MKYLLLAVVLSILSVTVSAKCADGYLCKDFLGNTYYNQNGMKHLTERNQRTIGLLSTIAKPPQTNIFANLAQLQVIQIQAAQIKAATTPKSKIPEGFELVSTIPEGFELVEPQPGFTPEDIEDFQNLTLVELESLMVVIELRKKYPAIQKLIDINSK